MKAIKYRAYGPSEMIAIQEVEKPVPQENEVLIRIHASSVTPTDIAFRKAKPFITRFFSGLFKPNFIPGFEFSGEVEAVGKDVDAYQIGDRVLGLSAKNSGTHAEYLCLPANAVMAKHPDNLSHEHAVGICDGALTALVFLKTQAKLQSNQRILINGASGAVGSYGVQLAKHWGAHITAVCGPSNVEWVSQLGADQVIDYTQHDFTQVEGTYDVIFDAVGKSSFSKCKKRLASNGMYLTTVLSMPILFQMFWTQWFHRKTARFVATGLQQTQENLQYLLSLVEMGALTPSIDRIYPLHEVRQAHQYVEQEHKRGNVVLRIA